MTFKVTDNEYGWPS